MIENHVGCYETGSLDFFGPLCVVACYVDQKDEKELNALELDKEMSSSDIERIGKILKDKLTYSLLLLDNSHYNQYVNEGQKLSCIKAKLYNQAMINVIQRIEHPVSKVTIDAFLSPKKYYRYLIIVFIADSTALYLPSFDSAAKQVIRYVFPSSS